MRLSRPCPCRTPCVRQSLPLLQRTRPSLDSRSASATAPTPRRWRAGERPQGTAMAEEKFLARWSRRKRAAAQEAAPPAAVPDRGEISQNASPERDKPAPAPNTPPSLPALDAIDGSTDIREFLAEGVPIALAR